MSADAVVLLGDVVPRAAGLDLEEAPVAVSHAVGAAHGVVEGLTDLLAASERETLNATFHWNYEDVFSKKIKRLNGTQNINKNGILFISWIFALMELLEFLIFFVRSKI